MKVTTINIKGLRDVAKRAAVLFWLSSSSSDIICLQETHCISEAELQSWFANSIFSPYGSFGTNRSAGTAILLRKSCNFVVQDFYSCDSGRFLFLKISTDSTEFTVASLYAPNHNPVRSVFLEDLVNLLDPTQDIILLGDFNSVANPELDRLSTRGHLHWSYDSPAEMAHLFQSCRVIDAWRYFHPHTFSSTFMSNSGQCQSRIDLICLPLRYIPKTLSCEIIPCPHSDHSAVQACFELPSAPESGPGLWKLNVSILEDEEYILLIENFWRGWQTRRHLYSSPAIWWDIGKNNIRTITINFCSKRKKKKQTYRVSLEARLRLVKSRLELGYLNYSNEYYNILASLARLDQECARASYIRTRLQWIEEGEQSNSFFLRLEKQNKAQSRVDVIEDSNGVLHSETSALLTTWRTFYQNLFTQSITDDPVQDTFIDSLERTLPPEASFACEGLLRADECLLALKGMSSNKTPGADGLPKEFYVTFWETIGGDLVSVLNSSFHSGVLSCSQRLGVITLIHKKGPRYLCKNYRPISLLCTDYKVASRVMAGRLRAVISHVISDDQTCAIPGRYIGENVRLLADSVTYANDQDEPLAILSLDQEKAFDRVDWAFMLRILRKMGFGSLFCSWVHLFYTGPLASVLVNGFVTLPFSLSRGVRQGCPLSASLYVIVAETLACKLRSCPRLKGLPLPNSDQFALVSQYADDTTLFCTADSEIEAVFDIYSDYEQASGAKLNLEKCKGLWCGSWSDRTSSPVDIQWSSSHLVCLGVSIGTGNLESENWNQRLQNLRKVLHSWRQRYLSLSGKALVINSLALSGLWYTASAVHMPDWVLQKIRALVYPFFWSGKTDRVKRNAIILPKEQGGFNLVEPQLKTLSLHAVWICRLECSSGKWRHFFSFFLRRFFGASVEDVLSNPAYYPPHLLPAFYASVLSSWALLDGHKCPILGLSFKDSETGVSVSVSTGSAKVFHQCLVANTSEAPHCIQKFRPIYGELYWPLTWRQIHSLPLDRKVRDLSWKVAHGVLYTCDRLVSFGQNIDPLCFCQEANETSEHLFFTCPFISALLLWAQTIFLRVTPLCPSLRPRHLLFGFDRHEGDIVPPVFFYLLCLIKYFVWLARNDFRFNGVRPDEAAVRSRVIARLNVHLKIHAKRFVSASQRRTFNRAWNVLGKFSPNIRII